MKAIPSSLPRLFKLPFLGHIATRKCSKDRSEDTQTLKGVSVLIWLECSSKLDIFWKKNACFCIFVVTASCSKSLHKM